MADISINCPHCLTQNVGCELLWEHETPGQKGHWALVGICRSCQGHVLFEVNYSLHLHGGTGPMVNLALKGKDANVIIRACYPAPPKQRQVDHVPANVALSLGEAEASFKAGNFSAAGAMYRKAMERALGHIVPKEAGMLNARIRAAEKSMAMPAAMIEWADEVRLLGNVAAHDDEDPTREAVAEAREFVHLFLTYAFDLPERVRKAKAQRQAN